MMFQFDFVRYAQDEDRMDNVVSVLASDYPSAVKKIRILGLPGFSLPEFELEAVYEVGTFQINRN